MWTDPDDKKRQANAQEELARGLVVEKVAIEKMEKGLYEDNRNQSSKESQHQDGPATIDTEAIPGWARRDGFARLCEKDFGAVGFFGLL